MKYKFGFLIASMILTPITFAGSIEAPPSPNFTGFYMGIGAGLSSLFVKDSFETVRASGLGGDADTNRYTYTSILYAAQLGFGKIFGNTYLGLEGLVTYSPLDDLDETGFSTAAGNILIVGNNTIKTSSNPIYNVDAVLGYAIHQSTLPFIEGGVTFGKVSRQYAIKRTRTNIVTTTNVGYETSLSVGKYNTGYNVGLGIRQLVGEHCVLSIASMYTYLGKNTDSSSVAIPGTTDVETHTRTAKNYALSLLGTISYLFHT